MATTHADRLLGRIHSDIAGPISPLTRGKERYIITFIDELSRYARVFPLKTNSATEVNDCLKKSITQAERQTSAKVLKFPTDGGPEYEDIVHQQLESLGILHEVTNPYTPHQNG